MGSPVSPVIADIFMENLEEKIFMETEAPRLWKRFVDDVLAVTKKNYGNMLLAKLNSAHENISFTMEEEADGTLLFMDVRFTRREWRISQNSRPKTHAHQ